MQQSIRSQVEILHKLGIEQLNPMQEETLSTIEKSDNIVLLSPTGTGKTLAYLLPIVSRLNVEVSEIQALIVVPSRELAIQIEQVIREMGTGFKANAVYGGRAGAKDKIDLKHRPAILVGTPGRLADHIRRSRFSTDSISMLVLDEFDKSLEIGFSSEMNEIVSALPNVQKKILTSATDQLDIPAFVKLKDPTYIDYLSEKIAQLNIKIIKASSEKKLDSLFDALCHIGNGRGIVFCNFKDTIEEVSKYLSKMDIVHGCFYGGMEQKDRERALIKFRNGTHQLLIATDLAARGIDVPEIKFIVHYQIPIKSQEFIHRNGRTARMNSDGTAYVLLNRNEVLPDFIVQDEIESIKKTARPNPPLWKTVFISGGRKDKISKGDIAGLFLKQGNLKSEELGVIELKQDCAFVAVHASQVEKIANTLDNSRLKKKKVRLSII